MKGDVDEFETAIGRVAEPRQIAPSTGFETSSKTRGNDNVSKRAGAKGGALGAELDPRLAQLIEFWPTLREETKTTILRLILDSEPT